MSVTASPEPLPTNMAAGPSEARAANKVAVRARSQLSFTVLPASYFAEIDRREAACSLAASSNVEIWWRSPFCALLTFPIGISMACRAWICCEECKPFASRSSRTPMANLRAIFFRLSPRRGV